MRESLLSYLRCPRSGGELEIEVHAREGEEVLEGILRSPGGHEYPIEAGIPNLVIGLEEKVRRTGDQFAFEFLQVGEPRDPESKRYRDLTLFSAKTGIDSRVYGCPGFDWRLNQDARDLGYDPDFSFLKDKVVVDAGCGDGRFASFAAAEARETILLDLGAQVGKAWYVTRERGNVHPVRCNLLHIPLRDEIADFAYSIGVIHHTPSPSSALKEIARSVKRGGELSVWVYPPAYWGNPIKKQVSLYLRRRLLAMELEEQVAFLRRWLMPLGRFQLRVARSKALKYLLAPLFLVNVPRHQDPEEMLATVIDYYLPEFIWTYEDRELEEMFLEAGLDYRRLPFPTAGRGVRRSS